MQPYNDPVPGTGATVRSPAPAAGLPGLLLLLGLLAHGAAAQVKVGLGSYATVAPGAVPASAPRYADGFARPPVTPGWWATLATSAFSGELYAHPACYKAVAKGLEVGYPGAPAVGGDGFYSPYHVGLTVGVDGMAAAEAEVAGYSHFSVTARWQAGGKSLEATFGHGLPFSYYRVTGGNATITSSGTVFHNEDGVLGIAAGGKAFGVFAPTGAAWTGTGTLSSTLAGKGYLSVAVLPDASEETLRFFRQYAHAHVKRTVVSWAYEGKTAMLVSTFGVETEAKEGAETGTVFALLRHQWLEAATPLTERTYASARGRMKVAVGGSFSTAMRFNGVLPAMPDVGRDLDVLKGLVASQAAGSGGGDSYNAGKAIGKLAALVPLAEAAGDAAKRDEFLSALKARLQEWLTAGGAQQLYYHKPHGSLIGYPAAYGSDTRLSDHHFHFGYFIQGAAAVARYDREWAKPGAWGGMVEMLIREINAWDEADPLFGRFRYFDPYEGHGWADGTGFPERGNNQESSSEAMNAYAGIILWGSATGNEAVRDLGIFMHVNESRAIEQYWFDVDGEVFPPGFAHAAVGMVWGNGGAYGTWFSADPSHIHGINILPITAGHLYLGRRPDHVLANHAEGDRGAWRDLFAQYLAFADGERAHAAYGAGLDPEGGSSRAYAYHHVSSLRAAGRLNVHVGADLPTFAVFDKAGTRTYTAYNPGITPVTVAFTDGFAMEAPAGAQVTRTGPVRPVAGLRAGPRGVLPGSRGPGATHRDLRGRALRGAASAAGARFPIPPP